MCDCGAVTRRTFLRLAGAESVITRHLSWSGNVHEFGTRVPGTRRVPGLYVAVHGQSIANLAVPENFAAGYPTPVPDLKGTGQGACHAAHLANSGERDGPRSAGDDGGRDPGARLGIRCRRLRDGLAGLGVPIFDRGGRLAGALSVSTLTGQMLEAGAPKHLDLLVCAAQAIATRVA